MKWLGIAFACCIALLADMIPLQSTVLALFGGMLIANLPGTPAAMKPGLAWTAKWVLLVAVILLGFRIQWSGLSAFSDHVMLLVLALSVPMFIGWSLHRKHGKTPLLIGIGTAICGVSAMAAAHPTVGGDEEEFAEAVGVVTILGSIGLMTYPLLSTFLGPETYGLLSGLTLHAVPQAVGAGFAGGAAAGALATTAKMARVAALPVVLALANPRNAKIPLELIGFLAAMVLGNTILAPRAESLGAYATPLLLLAFAAIGLQTKFKLRMGRAMSWGLQIWLGMVITIALVLWKVGP